MSLDLQLACAPVETLSIVAADLRVRVVLADDHALMRLSLRMLLDGEQDIEVIGEAHPLASVGRVVQAERPHVLVLDLGMRGGSSIETIRQLRELVPRTQIVATTMQDDPAFARHALAAGALGFVSKELADAEAPRAVRAAARGEEYISPRIAPGLDASQRSLTQGMLSSREVKVMRLIAHGYTSAAVARKLRISPRTVESHRARILAKLGLSTRAELLHYALGHGLFS